MQNSTSFLRKCRCPVASFTLTPRTGVTSGLSGLGEGLQVAVLLRAFDRITGELLGVLVQNLMWRSVKDRALREFLAFWKG